MFCSIQYKGLFLQACSMLLLSQSIAQEDSLSKPGNVQKDYTINLHYGAIYAQSIHVKNTAGAQPAAISFEMAKRAADEKTWNNYGCFPRTGIMLGYVNFNTPILGRSFIAAYLFEPTYRLGKRMDFFIKGRVGLSYLTNPFDSVTNPSNQSYSLPVNFFTSASTGIHYKTGKHISVSLGAHFFHYSNGGFAQPNRGINYPGFSAGLRYNPETNVSPFYKRIKDTAWKAKRTNYDLIVYYSPKQGYDAAYKASRKLLVGTGAQVSQRVNNLDAFTLGAEVYYDAGIRSIKYNLGDSSSNIFAGLMLGHEFVFRKLIFSQQLGIYLHKNTDIYTAMYSQPFPMVYHRWGLRYKIKEHWYLGFNFLAHKQVADFIDGRLIYRL